MLKINKTLTKSTFCFVLFFLFITVVAAHPLDLFKFNEITLDLVQISDVHLDSNAKGGSKRMLEYSADLLKDAISQVNNLPEAKLVIFSGDIVNHSRKNEFLNFLNITNGLRIPWYYAVGNHDVGILGGVSKAEITCLFDKGSHCLSRDSLYYSYSPNKNFLILFMDGVIDNEITANGYFPDKELHWLNIQLKNNPDKKVIIVQHFPVVEPYKSITHKVRNADEYLNIIDKYSNVIAVLSGHYHATKITQRKNVLHINTPSLVEYPNAFREIKITKLNDSTKFEIKLIETNLKNIQVISKGLSKNHTLEEGKDCDKNTVIIIKNQG
ncbi:MAG: metallophosphoesterase [bacterium]